MYMPSIQRKKLATRWYPILRLVTVSPSVAGSAAAASDLDFRGRIAAYDALTTMVGPMLPRFLYLAPSYSILPAGQVKPNLLGGTFETYAAIKVEGWRRCAYTTQRLSGFSPGHLWCRRAFFLLPVRKRSTDLSNPPTWAERRWLERLVYTQAAFGRWSQGRRLR